LVVPGDPVALAGDREQLCPLYARPDVRSGAVGELRPGDVGICVGVVVSPKAPGSVRRVMCLVLVRGAVGWTFDRFVEAA